MVTVEKALQSGQQDREKAKSLKAKEAKEDSIRGKLSNLSNVAKVGGFLALMTGVYFVYKKVIKKDGSKGLSENVNHEPQIAYS